MTAVDNKMLVQHIYEELSSGNSRPLVEAMADDVRWALMGTMTWSRVYEGKEAVLTRLLTPLRARFAGRYEASAERIIAEGDLVVAEVRGRVTTRSGSPYHNRYCFIFRIEGGKIREMREYMDTELAAAVLGEPDD